MSLNCSNLTIETWKCEEHHGKCAYPDLRADPDIAGFGVIVSLVASILLSIVASLGCLICASAWPRKHVVNRIDAWILPRLGKQVSKRFGAHHPVRNARICFDLVTCLSDQQMVTAVALLIATLKKLHVDKTISVYHFTFVVGIIQVSSTAYEFAILSQSSVVHLEEAHGKRYPEIVFWAEEAKPWYKRLRDWMPWGLRMVLNHTLDTLLLYILWVAARSGWYYDAKSPAHCVLKSYPTGSAGQTGMIINYIMVISSDIARILSLFPPIGASRTLYLLPRLVDSRSLPTHYPSQTNLHDHQFSTEKARPQVKTKMSPGIGLILDWAWKILKFIFASLWIIFNSTFANAAVQITWCVYFLWDTFDTKVWGQSFMEEQERQAEKEMGFGQIVPVFLLILLVLRVFDSLWKPTLNEKEFDSGNNGDEGSTLQDTKATGTSLKSQHASTSTISVASTPTPTPRGHHIGQNAGAPNRSYHTMRPSRTWSHSPA